MSPSNDQYFSRKTLVILWSNRYKTMGSNLTLFIYFKNRSTRNVYRYMKVSKNVYDYQGLIN